MTSLPSRREGGFTLLELLLVIGVAALLLIGGIATYRLVSDGNKATEAARLLLTLRQESQVFAQQMADGYTTIAYDSTASDADNMFVAAGILRDQQNNPFGGDITITGTDTELTITFTGVSRPGCVKLFSAITNPSELVTVMGTAPDAITPAAAATTCADDASNDMVWVLK